MDEKPTILEKKIAFNTPGGDDPPDKFQGGHVPPPPGSPPIRSSQDQIRAQNFLSKSAFIILACRMYRKQMNNIFTPT